GRSLGYPRQHFSRRGLGGSGTEHRRPCATGRHAWSNSMSHDVEARIRAFIPENFMIGQDATALGSEDSFLDSGIIDSTGVLELISFLEEAFGIQVEDEEMIPSNLDSIANLQRFIASKQS